jgi:hypothetical protein
VELLGEDVAPAGDHLGHVELGAFFQGPDGLLLLVAAVMDGEVLAGGLEGRGRVEDHAGAGAAGGGRGRGLDAVALLDGVHRAELDPGVDHHVAAAEDVVVHAADLDAVEERAGALGHAQRVDVLAVGLVEEVEGGALHQVRFGLLGGVVDGGAGPVEGEGVAAAGAPDGLVLGAGDGQLGGEFGLGALDELDRVAAGELHLLAHGVDVLDGVDRDGVEGDPALQAQRGLPGGEAGPGSTLHRILGDREREGDLGADELGDGLAVLRHVEELEPPRQQRRALEGAGGEGVLRACFGHQARARAPEDVGPGERRCERQGKDNSEVSHDPPSVACPGAFAQSAPGRESSRGVLR